MSFLRTALRRAGITDRKHFDLWLDAALKKDSPYKRLMTAYDRSLADIELTSARYEVWLRVNWNKPGFEVGYKRWNERMKRLQAMAMGRLERILRAYQRDSQRR